MIAASRTGSISPDDGRGRYCPEEKLLLGLSASQTAGGPLRQQEAASNRRPSCGRSSPMSLVPSSRGDHEGCLPRWQTIMHAIDDWHRTIRLCVIFLVTGFAPVPSVAIALLLRHCF